MKQPGMWMHIAIEISEDLKQETLIQEGEIRKQVLYYLEVCQNYKYL